MIDGKMAQCVTHSEAADIEDVTCLRIYSDGGVSAARSNWTLIAQQGYKGVLFPILLIATA